MRRFNLSKGKISIPLFFFIALSILFLGHYFIYASIIHFFGTPASTHHLALVIVLIALPLSVVASLFIAHWSNSLFARVFYFCATLWLGVGLTLLITLCAAWIVQGVTQLAHGPANSLWFGYIAVALTAAYSLYGVWNAYHPRIVTHTVRLKNLPANWRGKTLIQISDVHLGRVFGERFLSRVVTQVNAQKPDIVVITGDLFDGVDGALEKMVAPLNRMKSPKGTYFITGNHETYLGVQRSFEALRATPVTVLDNHAVDVEGLQVVGLSFPHRGSLLPFNESLGSVVGFDPNKASVLLYHSPTQIEAAKAAGVGLQLSGHVHHAQLFPLQLVTRLMFGKYHYGLHTEGDFTVYTTSGTGLWGPTMRTGNHPEIVVFKLT